MCSTYYAMLPIQRHFCVRSSGGGGGEVWSRGLEEHRALRLALQGAQMMRIIVANGAW